MKLDAWDTGMIRAHEYLATLKYVSRASGWDACDMKADYVSVSRLKLLDQCPQSFLFSYVLKWPRGNSNPAAAFGQLVHQVFEDLMHWVVNNKIQGIVPIEKVHELFRSAWKTSEVTDANYYSEGTSIIDNYFNRRPDIDYTDILGIEVEFNIIIQGVQVMGYMDRVDRVGNDVHIVDYKTNRMLYFREDLAVDIQASIYTIAARILWPWAERIIFHFEMLRFATTQTVERTPAQISLAENYVVDMTHQSERRGHEWAAKTGPLCAFCDNFNKCETVQDAIANGTEIVPVDSDDLLEVTKESQRLKKVMAPIKAQVEKLDKVIKAQVERSQEPIIIGEYRYRMMTINRKTYDLDMVTNVFERFGVERSEVEKRVVTVDKKSVDELVKEVKKGITGKGANAKKTMFAMDVEACRDEEFHFAKLDCRLADHVLAPAQVDGELSAKEVPCAFCGTKPAKLVERGGARFAVCVEHKKKRKPPPKQIGEPALLTP